MKRVVVLAVCLIACAGRPALAAPPTRPLSEIFFDAGAGDLDKVKEIATLQAKEQWKMDKGPLYKSAPARQNGDPNKFSDEQYFEGFVTPASNGSKLAVFSDDGCDVWIDNQLVLNNFKKGQHLPDLKQSLHVPDKFKPVAGRVYHVKIHYCNTIYQGKTDIDGCTLFAFAGGADVVEVKFVNETRGGDRVVSARDKKLDLPGGTKELKVEVTPKNTTVRLTIKRKDKDTSGSASFDEKKEVLEKDVKNGDTVTVYGRNVSGKPRDVSLEASVDKKAVATFDFTVFRVDLSLLPNGQEITPKAVNESGIVFREFMQGATGSTKVGMFFAQTRKGPRAGGLELTIGRVVPSGIDPADFFRSKKPG